MVYGKHPGVNLTDPDVLHEMRRLDASGWTPNMLDVADPPLPTAVKSPTRFALARLRGLPDDPTSHPALMLRERATSADQRRVCFACSIDDNGTAFDDEHAVWVEVPDEPAADAGRLRGFCQTCFTGRMYKLAPPVARRFRNVLTGEEWEDR